MIPKLFVTKHSRRKSPTAGITALHLNGWMTKSREARRYKYIHGANIKFIGLGIWSGLYDLWSPCRKISEWVCRVSGHVKVTAKPVQGKKKKKVMEKGICTSYILVARSDVIVYM